MFGMANPRRLKCLMLGERSWLFDLVALFYGMVIRLDRSILSRGPTRASLRPASFDPFISISLLILVVAALVFAQPYHLQHIPFVSEPDRSTNQSAWENAAEQIFRDGLSGLFWGRQCHLTSFAS